MKGKTASGGAAGGERGALKIWFGLGCAGLPVYALGSFWLLRGGAQGLAYLQASEVLGALLLVSVVVHGVALFGDATVRPPRALILGGAQLVVALALLNALPFLAVALFVAIFSGAFGGSALGHMMM